MSISLTLECTVAPQSSLHSGLSLGNLFQVSLLHEGHRCPLVIKQRKAQGTPTEMTNAVVRSSPILWVLFNCPQKTGQRGRGHRLGAWSQRRAGRSFRWAFSCWLSFCHSCGSVSVFQDMLKLELGKEEFFYRLLLHFSDVMKL